MNTSGNHIADDNGEACASPYHDSSRCSKCLQEENIEEIRHRFREAFERVEGNSYNDIESKLNALFELEDMFPELNVDIDAIMNKDKSYLCF